MEVLLPIQRELRALADRSLAQHSMRFFKTSSGEYGEGDRFLGIRVPVVRKMAGTFVSMNMSELDKLIASEFHEERLCALVILVKQFEKAGCEDQKKIYDFYLAHIGRINNWDLVDVSAPHIAGAWLLDKDRSILYELAASESLWNRRISIISTFTFIRNLDFSDTFAIAEMLLRDEHDLIHKAAGWMLREVGKRSHVEAKSFLDTHHKTMPRTMLRYAIEKFPATERKFYLLK
jgi:3-methyladenine DNA glycosylase AlkD